MGMKMGSSGDHGPLCGRGTEGGSVFAGGPERTAKALPCPPDAPEEHPQEALELDEALALKAARQGFAGVHRPRPRVSDIAPTVDFAVIVGGLDASV
jgi:hypothetical protein